MRGNAWNASTYPKQSTRSIQLAQHNSVSGWSRSAANGTRKSRPAYCTRSRSTVCKRSNRAGNTLLSNVLDKLLTVLIFIGLCLIVSGVGPVILAELFLIAIGYGGGVY